MVASGVPEKTDHHASEMAKMALDLLAKVSHFFIRYTELLYSKLRFFLTDLFKYFHLRFAPLKWFTSLGIDCVYEWAYIRDLL